MRTVFPLPDSERRRTWPLPEKIRSAGTIPVPVGVAASLSAAVESRTNAPE